MDHGDKMAAAVLAASQCAALGRTETTDYFQAFAAMVQAFQEAEQANVPDVQQAIGNLNRL